LLKDQAPLIAEAEDLGYTELWTAEANLLDGFTPLALAALNTKTARLGTAIVSTYTRAPLVMAQHAASLNELAPGRVVLGLGSSATTIVQDWNGVRFRKPVPHVRDTYQAVRALLDGQRVTEKFETFELIGSRYGGPLNERIPIYLAALRPKMLRLAGQLADGVIINMLSAAEVPRSLAEVAAGAEASGRSPSDVDVACRIFVIVTNDSEAVEEVAKRYRAGYLPVGTYKKFQEWLGRGEVLREMGEAWERGERKEALAKLPMSVVNDLIVIGPPERCKERIIEYCEAGVAMPMLAFVGGDPVESMRAMSPSALNL
jgi:probable F420-dependent oxidoreductase